MLKFSGCSCLSSGRMMRLRFFLLELSRGLDWSLAAKAGRRHASVEGCLPDCRPGAGTPREICYSAEPLVQRHDQVRQAPRRAAGGDGEGETTLSQTCLWPKPQAQFAFKDSMIHMILQFTLGIAFRCVLHRCGSQDIRC